MVPLVDELIAFELAEDRDVFEIVGVSSHNGSPFEEFGMLGQSVGLCVDASIVGSPFSRDALWKA